METEMEAKEENRGVHSDEDGEDPCKIQIELDMLNSASESINKLETELEKARNKFQKTKAEASTQLNQLLKKTGKRFVVSAQPFYKLSKQLQEEQLDAQKAAAKYQDAFSAYMSAKNEVSRAEQRMTATDDAVVMTIDSTCQEILNKTTMMLLDAEKEKVKCEQEHHLKTLQCADYQKRMTQLLKDKGLAIQKAKPFYEMRDVLEKRLKVEKQNAEDLQLALVCNKQKYKHALSNLEQMSEEVHARRKSKLALPPRTPGVGAETESEMSDLPSSHFDMFSDSASQDSLEFCDDKEFSESPGHNCSTVTLNEWEVPTTQFVQSEDDKLTFDPHSRGAEVNGGTEADLCRDDFLEGAETVSEASAVESVAGRELPADSFAGVSAECLAKSGTPVGGRSGTKVSDGLESASVAQRRTMAVKDLSTGIYVASTLNPKMENAATDAARSATGQATIDGSKKNKILLQFPLLQSLVGRPNASSQQNV